MRPSSPSKASAMPAASTDHPATTFTPQQKHARTLRRLKSAHALSSHHGQSHAPSLASLQRQHQQHHQHAPQPPIPPQQSQPQSHIRTSRSPQKDVSTAHAPPVQPLHGHGRTRSNTDATPLGLCTESHPQRHHAATKKMVTSGSSGNKGLSLDVLVREGPRNGDIKGGLECMRYQVLSNGVGSDHDGMSSLRIYVWLILLCAPPIPTDDYLALVHRGPSPAYAKIRNDTFRTLATDPLFRRRVSEASLIRLLNAVAWTLSDRKEEQLRSSRSAVLNSATDNGSPELRHVAPVTNHPPPPPPPPPRSAAMSPDGDAHSVDGGPEAGTYVQGMNVIAAPFLYAARSEAEAFVAFQRFITLECPGYVRGAMDGVHRGLALVDKVLAIVDPKLSSYLLSKNMHAELYAFPSVLTLCACTPPLPEVLHLWDFLFAYGAHLNILCVVAQLITIRDTILESPSPVKILRSFPPLDAGKIKALAVSLVGKIPDHLYEEIVRHAK